MVNKSKTVGTAMFIIGIILVANSATEGLTGYTISEGLNGQGTPVIGLVLMIAGLTIALLREAKDYSKTLKELHKEGIYDPMIDERVMRENSYVGMKEY